MTSAFLKLNLNDFGKGLLVAVCTGAIVVVQKFVLDCGIACIDWTLVLNAGVAGGLAYLVKNLFTDTNGKLGRARR